MNMNETRTPHLHFVVPTKLNNFVVHRHKFRIMHGITRHGLILQS